MKGYSNLKSISWYLSSLSKRALESELANPEEFLQRALIAKESLDDLISLLEQKADDSPQTDSAFGKRAK